MSFIVDRIISLQKETKSTALAQCAEARCSVPVHGAVYRCTVQCAGARCTEPVHGAVYQCTVQYCIGIAVSCASRKVYGGTHIISLLI